MLLASHQFLHHLLSSGNSALGYDLKIPPSFTLRLARADCYRMLSSWASSVASILIHECSADMVRTGWKGEVVWVVVPASTQIHLTYSNPSLAAVVELVALEEEALVEIGHNKEMMSATTWLSTSIKLSLAAGKFVGTVIASSMWSLFNLHHAAVSKI